MSYAAAAGYAAKGLKGQVTFGKGKSLSNSTILIVFFIIVFAIFGYGMWNYVTSFLEALGFKKSKEDEAVDDVIADDAQPGDPWNPNSWKGYNNGNKPMYYDAADKIVKDIWDAAGGFNDYEGQIIGAFRKLKTRAQVSFVVDRFYAYHKEDLLIWLQGQVWPNDRLSNEDLLIITNYVKKLTK